MCYLLAGIRQTQQLDRAELQTYQVYLSCVRAIQTSWHAIQANQVDIKKDIGKTIKCLDLLSNQWGSEKGALPLTCESKKSYDTAHNKYPTTKQQQSIFNPKFRSHLHESICSIWLSLPFTSIKGHLLNYMKHYHILLASIQVSLGLPIVHAHVLTKIMSPF